MNSISHSNIKHKRIHPKSEIGKFAIKILFIVCIAYNSGYVLTTTNEDIGRYLMLLVTIPLFLMCLNRNILIGKINKYTSIYLFWIMISLCSIIVNFSFLTVNSFILTILMVTFAFCITNFIDFKTFSRYFIMCMKIITITSLIAYVLVVYFEVNINLPKVTNINGIGYHNGIIFFIMESVAGVKLRNIGIFWEPGLFSSFLIMAMVFEMYFKPGKMSAFNMIIFILGLISTQSTAGYVLSIFIVALFISRSDRRNSLWSATVIIIIATCAYIWYDSIITFLLNYNYDVFIKVAEMSGSGFTRLYGPTLNFEVFKSYPFFGAGFGNANIIYSQNMFTFGVSAQTSTSTYFMASLGIFGALYTLLWIYGVFKIRNMNLVGRISLILILLIILNKEPHTTILFMYCFLFYLLKESTIIKTIIEKEN